MPLTDAQRNVLPEVRTMFTSVPPVLGTAESVEQRARHPAPEALPLDLSVRIEIAPPSLHLDPTLAGTGALKSPERVPIYFFALHSDSAGANIDPSPEEVANTHVIFFIHGGGNVAGHPTVDIFMQYYAELLRAVSSSSGGTAKCVLAAPSYRLATVPECIFPAGLQDVLAAYDYVLGKGYKASNIVIAGDSAGGNHAVVLTHLVLQSGRPLPHGVVALAPGTVVVHDVLSDHAKSQADRDVISFTTLDSITRAYLGNSGISPADPLVYGPFLPFSPSWPRMLILVGTGDILIDQAREIVKRLAALDRPVELVEYDERPHGWWVLPHIFPEDVQDSAERISRFVLG